MNVGTCTGSAHSPRESFLANSNPLELRLLQDPDIAAMITHNLLNTLSEVRVAPRLSTRSRVLVSQFLLP
jgi:hypothetical protein